MLERKCFLHPPRTPVSPKWKTGSTSASRCLLLSVPPAVQGDKENLPETEAPREDAKTTGTVSSQGLMASFSVLDGGALGFPGVLEVIQLHFSSTQIGFLSFL